MTSGEHEGSTFVEWTGNFSSDADAGQCNLTPLTVLMNSCEGADKFSGVIQDAKFKRREALADLAKVATKK